MRSHLVPPAHRLLALLPLVLAAPLAVAVPSFDPFADATAAGGSSYAVGTPLVGQVNNTLFGPWYLRGGNFGATQPMIVSGNLSYPTMPQSSGNSVAVQPAASMSACVDLNLTAGHTNTVYYSFLLKVTDLSAVPDSPTNNPIVAFLDDPSLAFSNNQIGRLGSRLVTKRVGAGYVLGIGMSSSGNGFVYEPDEAAHDIDEVLFVVGSFQREVNVQTNLDLWINPAPDSFGSSQPPAPTLVAPIPASLTGAINTNNARAFGILCQFPTAPAAVIDDVRLAIDDWGYVTGGDPAILTQPVSQTAVEGSTAMFTVEARGTAPLSYQWYKDGSIMLSDGGNLSGTTSSTLTISSVSGADVGDYSVTVMNGLNASITSVPAHLALTDPMIVSGPTDLVIPAGSNVVLHVMATGTGPLTYQWHKEGVGDLSDSGNISGSQSDTLTIAGASYPDTGNYSVTVRNSLGATTESATALVIVQDPFITVQPVPVTTSAGSQVMFHVEAGGTGPFTFQWLKQGQIIFDLGNLSGTSTDTLTISDVSAADEANYSVAIFNNFTNITSDSVTLTVATPVSIAVQPNPRTVTPGSRVVFVVAAAGSGPFTYQWQHDGMDIPGASLPAYVIPSAQADLAGDYQVVVSNDFSSASSQPAALMVSETLTLEQSNLIVIRVGDGAQTLTKTGNSVYLDQFTPSGSYVNTVTIPEDGPTAMTAIGWDNVNGVQSGSTTGSCINRSLDGRFMVIAFYNTNLNYSSDLNLSLGAEVPRGIGLVDSFGQYTLAVSSTNAIFDNPGGSSFWRAAITDGTNNYWGSDSVSGTFYFGFDADPVLIQDTFQNPRCMRLFNGNIYLTEAGVPRGIMMIEGLPTAPVTPTILFDDSDGTSTGTFDLTVSPDGKLIYVADQRAINNASPNSGGGIQRWESADGINWTRPYTFTDGFGAVGPRYVAADFSGAHPVIYATSNDRSFDNDRLMMIEDTGASSPGVTLAYAGVNQTFRGLEFGPVPNPVQPRPTLHFERQNDNLILSWSGEFMLQSSQTVTGPYGTVMGATSPYTNSITAPDQLFFRLSN